ncbi:MAG: hypothetical protein U1E28_04960 [Beijerinckiaceae bacterium]
MTQAKTGEAQRRKAKGDHKGAAEQEKLDKALKDTFPASDPPEGTQPGGGITGVEPPPKGQKTGR